MEWGFLGWNPESSVGKVGIESLLVCRLRLQVLQGAWHSFRNSMEWPRRSRCCSVSPAPSPWCSVVLAPSRSSLPAFPRHPNAARKVGRAPCVQLLLPVSFRRRSCKAAVGLDSALGLPASKEGLHGKYSRGIQREGAVPAKPSLLPAASAPLFPFLPAAPGDPLGSGSSFPSRALAKAPPFPFLRFLPASQCLPGAEDGGSSGGKRETAPNPSCPMG